MGIRFVNLFTKVTAWPVQFLCFRTRILYEDKEKQSRRIRGSAIIISNHTSVFDYAVFLFVFIGRTLRYQMAEILFEKKPLCYLLKGLGGIRIDRDSHDFSFMARSEAILKQGGVIGIFPEGRLAREGEERPLPFQPGAAYLALSTQVPVIPVYTNGSYFNRKRAVVMIGTPMHVSDYTDPLCSDKDNIAAVNTAMRDKIIALGKKVNELSVL
ncbi:MAG: 1-acyl-sn-glycerol-3-phosphate acyltransferase [Lachnospiraceae bacterium]|nr:1-acyl-sn-glycerol-3-phosphate acyltransferase [Lachnospiraceae bacterium]